MKRLRGILKVFAVYYAPVPIGVACSFVHSARIVRAKWHVNPNGHRGEGIAVYDRFCDDVDSILEGLVSPAPESFHVLTSAVCKISGDTERVCLDDLNALTFLVKPTYAIELYSDSKILKWRLVPRGDSNIGVVYTGDCSLREPELYHQHSILQLSKIALDVATTNPNDPENLQRIHAIVQQAEVRF